MELLMHDVTCELQQEVADGSTVTLAGRAAAAQLIHNID